MRQAWIGSAAAGGHPGFPARGGCDRTAYSTLRRELSPKSSTLRVRDDDADEPRPSISKVSM